MAKQYRCYECDALVYPVARGRYWRHYHAPRDGHRVTRITEGNNRLPIRVVEDIVLAETHPALFVIKKGIEIGAGIYKQLKDD